MHLVLVRSSGYVTDSATEAAATDIAYFFMGDVSELRTRNLEMSSSAYRRFFC